MGDAHIFFVLGTVCLVGGIGLGVGCERMRHPPTYTDQWESVYATCVSAVGDEPQARRAECIAAADRVMKCAKEVKP